MVSKKRKKRQMLIEAVENSLTLGVEMDELG
jgi:hypothetical protein